MAGEAFLLASVLVSFLAGIVALSMPCCFSVLLPSYLASCFKKRTAILGMTLVFALGAGAVLLPIALGIGALSTLIGLNHSLLFVIGGFFMVFLGVSSLLGIQLIPMINPDVDLQKTSVPSVFVLGAFSGVASSCCAPVLAGMLVLTALSSSLIASALVGVAYVAGMVFPLFLVAVFMGRSRSIQKVLQGRMVNTRLGAVHSSKLLSAAIFLSMGAVTIYLGVTNTMIVTPGSELFNIYETAIQNAVNGFVSSPLALAVFLAAVVLGIGFFVRTRIAKPRTLPPGEL